jgi:SpoVK/Ycf46/Vps4 family AAA+-type ATPase
VNALPPQPSKKAARAPRRKAEQGQFQIIFLAGLAAWRPSPSLASRMPRPSHVRDEVVPELAALHFGRAFHEAGEVVGDLLARDRAVDALDDEIGRFDLILIPLEERDSMTVIITKADPSGSASLV